MANLEPLPQEVSGARTLQYDTCFADNIEEISECIQETVYTDNDICQISLQLIEASDNCGALVCSLSCEDNPLVSAYSEAYQQNNCGAANYCAGSPTIPPSEGPGCEQDAYDLCLAEYFNDATDTCEQTSFSAAGAAACGLSVCGTPCHANEEVANLEALYQSDGCGILDACNEIISPPATEGLCSSLLVEEFTICVVDTVGTPYDYCQAFYNSLVAYEYCGEEVCGLTCEENIYIQTGVSGYETDCGEISSWCSIDHTLPPTFPPSAPSVGYELACDSSEYLNCFLSLLDEELPDEVCGQIAYLSEGSRQCAVNFCELSCEEDGAVTAFGVAYGQAGCGNLNICGRTSGSSGFSLVATGRIYFILLLASTTLWCF